MLRWLVSALPLLALSPAPAEPANILGIFPFKGASHFYVFRPLLEELVRRGHNLTVVSHMPRKEKLANYTDISLVHPSDKPKGFVTFDFFEEHETTFYQNMMHEIMVGLKHLMVNYEKALKRPEVLTLTNQTFDLVIIEMFNSDLFYGLTYKIGAPVIGFCSSQMLPWTADTMGAPNDLAYIPNLPGGLGPEMGFYDRFINLVQVWVARAFYRFHVNSEAQVVAEKYLGPLPNLGDIAANTSLLFLNSHFTVLGQRPLPPSIIEIAGINIPEPKPLPEDLKKIYDKSKGVIYFSMGSVLAATSMPENKQAMFIKAFLETGRTILWKREEPLYPEHPNIITRKWFPQRDILAHPKTELFIGHCGINGMNEAVASAVPMICLPMFGDQPWNANYVVHAGIGLKISYISLSENDLRTAINEVLTNKKYAQKAADLSLAFKDRPISPLDTAVYWTEYVLRHGPKPFEAPFKQMPLWMRLGYDIAAVLLTLVFTAVYLVVVVVRALRSDTKYKKLKQS